MNTIQTITTDSSVVQVLPADPQARVIGSLFQKAESTRTDCIRYLIDAGHRLKARRDSLSHGQWLPWLETNRETLGFGERTAQKLIAAAGKLNPTLTSDLPAADVLKLSRQVWGNDRPRKPKIISTEARSSEPPSLEQRSPESATDNSHPLAHDDEPERPDMEALDKEASESFDRELQASVDKWLRSDSKLAAAQKEIERQAAEIVALKVTRNGYMNGRNEVIERYKGAQRQIKRLERSKADLERENIKLRDENLELREYRAKTEESA